MLNGLGVNNIRFWDMFYDRQREAEKYNLGDHVTAEEAMEFVKNGGEITIQPEKTVIQPDDNWTFGDDASIEDIMNWMNSRDGARLTDGLDAGVNAGVYSPVNTGEQLTSQDVAAFEKIPGEMTQAVAKAVGGIKVQMDRATVGYLVAPIVSNIIANQVG